MCSTVLLVLHAEYFKETIIAGSYMSGFYVLLGVEIEVFLCTGTNDQSSVIVT